MGFPVTSTRCLRWFKFASHPKVRNSVTQTRTAFSEHGAFTALASPSASTVSQLICHWDAGLKTRSYSHACPRLGVSNSLSDRNELKRTTLHRRRFSHFIDGNLYPPPITKETNHPSLYYHLFDSGPHVPKLTLALSFLETRPSSVISRRIIGWLPLLVPDVDDEDSVWDHFKENEFFLPLLHEGVKLGLPKDEIWKNAAIQTQSGWMHIFDQRNPPPQGRISSPDDIIASVRVEDGAILPDTYQPMPSYRVSTKHGICQLTDGLMESVKEVVNEVHVCL